jgi:lipoteichoic acid synthase
LRAILDRREWVYLLSLLVPFVVYTLALRAYEIASQPGDLGGLTQALDLMRSDVFFDLGYALFWIGLFAVARRRSLRLVIILLFHATTVLMVVTTTVAHHYFVQNGTTLDYGTIAEWIPKFQEVVPILFQGRVPVLAWMLFAAALLYAALGPLFLARTAERWREWPTERFSNVPTETNFLGSL